MEIKYRAWNHRTESWETNENFDCYLDEEQHGTAPNHYIVNTMYNEGPDENVFTFQLASGLNDEKGKEMYVGDIVKCGYGTGTIIFHAGCFMVEWIDDREANRELLFSRKGAWVRKGDEVFTIIGNIFENEELLKRTA